MDEWIKKAENELLNWGYCNHDGWLSQHAGYSIPPTSEQYVPPTGDIYDDRDDEEPLDFQAAALTESIVVDMAMEGAVGHERHCVLVYYYTRLMVCHLANEATPLTRSQATKRLSKHLHTSFPGARRMLQEAVNRYWEKRCTVKTKRRRWLDTAANSVQN